ncbi:MAG TPA: ABC transporter permease [Caulobacteraceae bacterium]|jgi:putative ABC transport system permease protein|nr:ABC transporter permease [Caulobacteraceae bacterium]
MFKQTFAVIGMNIASLPQRLASSLVTVIGVACVVAVMVSLLAIGAGLLQSAENGASADQAIVLSAGAAAAYMGQISREQAAIIEDAPGIKIGPDGKPMIDAEATIVVEVNKISGGSTNTAIVGASPRWLTSQRNFRIVSGRMYRPAVREIIVGKSATAQFKDLALGDHIRLRGSEWTVVGVFEAGGGLSENALIGDTDTVLSAFERNAFQTVEVQLQSPAAFGRFKDALTSNPQLQVDVKRQSQYMKDQLAQVTTLLNFVGYFVGVIMAVGATFGAINTMYAAVDARSREIATLRAIGFGGGAVLISVMVESLLLAVPGALLGAAAAWLLFNGHAANIASLSFPLAVTPALVVLGIVFSLIIGLIGGFLPSIRAARLPVATALRAV